MSFSKNIQFKKYKCFRQFKNEASEVIEVTRGHLRSLEVVEVMEVVEVVEPVEAFEAVFKRYFLICFLSNLKMRPRRSFEVIRGCTVMQLCYIPQAEHFLFYDNPMML